MSNPDFARTEDQRDNDRNAIVTVSILQCQSGVNSIRSSKTTNREQCVMNPKSKITLAVVVGAALGAAAIQGLHAQATAKAYTVSELETLDAAANVAFVPVIAAAQQAAGGRNLRTGGGKIIAMEGGTAPKRVATEWDSLAKAQAFYNSKAWNDLTPQREKAVKTTRRYIVEVAN
jgi:uncharacterized protein (DUF1330 family)